MSRFRALLPALFVCVTAAACADDSPAMADSSTTLDSSIADVDSPPADSFAESSMPDGSTDSTAPDAAAWPPAPDVILRDRSLTWTHAALLDDRALLGLGRLMATLSSDTHGGRLFDQWFRRFATTAHSERLGPQLILEQLERTAGDAPERWDLDTIPFRVTGVHNRIDLVTDSHCGEIRVSLASTDAVLQPLHLIFLFAQPAQPADRDSGGRLHCRATAHRWAGLSALDDAAFLEAARAIVEESLRADTFLVVETLEFLISPWEWRQWFLEPNPDSATAAILPFTLENRPLFQTIDVPRLNRPGPERDEFLDWVAANAAELDARRVLFPDRFRPLSARVNQGVPWVALDLDGLPPDVGLAFPRLRQQIEIVGCPACHSTDAELVQTSAERVFSPFYDKELDAREVYLRALADGMASPPGFGPLQPNPRLPP